MKSNSRAEREKATKLFNKYTHLAFDHCVICGCPNFRVHHLIFKSQSKALSCDPDNAAPLCASCHWLAHFQQPEFETLIEEKLPGIMALLRSRLNEPPDFIECAERLREELRRIEQ
jgi:hypothetical protein